jgi:oxalate decarboxylase/phosphoglucose isomerase-like protein (cupin superfamily)
MKETTMHMLTTLRRIGVLAAIVAIAGLLLTPATGAIAKEDPFHTVNSLPLTSTQEPIAAGAWMETLGTMAQADSNSSVVLARITLEPGARLRAHGHPGTAVITVQSGELETQLLRGSGTIYRGAADVIEPVFAESATATLHEGDSIAYEQTCAKTMANAGDEPLVLFLSLVADDGQPLFSFDAPPPSRNPSLQ